MDADLLIDQLEAEPNVENSCAFLLSAGVDIGLLKREHEGCKAWVHDFEWGNGLTENYMDARELRAAAVAFRTLAEHVERATLPDHKPIGRQALHEGRCRPCDGDGWCENYHGDGSVNRRWKCKDCGGTGRASGG